MPQGGSAYAGMLLAHLGLILVFFNWVSLGLLIGALVPALLAGSSRKKGRFRVFQVMSSFAEAGRELFLSFGNPLLTMESFRLPNNCLHQAALLSGRSCSVAAVAAQQLYCCRLRSVAHLAHDTPTILAFSSVSSRSVKWHENC